MIFDGKHVPKSFQESFGRSKRVPGGAPRNPQGPPKDPQGSQRSLQKLPRAPKKTPRVPQRTSKAPRDLPRSHQGLLETQCWVICDVKKAKNDVRMGTKMGVKTGANIYVFFCIISVKFQKNNQSSGAFHAKLFSREQAWDTVFYDTKRTSAIVGDATVEETFVRSLRSNRKPFSDAGSSENR